MAKSTGGGNVVSLVPGSGKLDGDEDRWRDEYHIPARDTNGHTDKIQFKVPPSLKALVYIIMESKVFPYPSIGYLFRDALVRHCNLLSLQPGGDVGVGSTIHAINAMIEIVREDEFMEDFRTIFDKLEERVNEHLRRRNDKRARGLVVKTWGKIKQMEDEFWRGEYEKELRKRFGDMLTPNREG